MPNHYHLLVKQSTYNGITKLMRAINTNYVMYFNKKYDRVGHLFASKYKAVLVKTDEQLLHLSRYIHINPLKLLKKLNINNLSKYPYSSYGYYLRKKSSLWIKPKFILDSFQSEKKKEEFPQSILSYQNFVENYQDEDKLLSTVIRKITLE